MIGVDSEVADASPAAAPAFNTVRLETLPFKLIIVLHGFLGLISGPMVVGYVDDNHLKLNIWLPIYTIVQSFPGVNKFIHSMQIYSCSMKPKNIEKTSRSPRSAKIG